MRKVIEKIEFETMERRILISFLHNDKSREVEVSIVLRQK